MYIFKEALTRCRGDGAVFMGFGLRHGQLCEKVDATRKYAGFSISQVVGEGVSFLLDCISAGANIAQSPRSKLYADADGGYMYAELYPSAAWYAAGIIPERIYAYKLTAEVFSLLTPGGRMSCGAKIRVGAFTRDGAYIKSGRTDAYDILLPVFSLLAARHELATHGASAFRTGVFKQPNAEKLMRFCAGLEHAHENADFDVDYADAALPMSELEGMTQILDPEDFDALSVITDGCCIFADSTGEGTDTIGEAYMDSLRRFEQTYFRAMARLDALKLFYIRGALSRTDGNDIFIDPFFAEDFDRAAVREAIRLMTSGFFDRNHIILCSARGLGLHEMFHILYSDFGLRRSLGEALGGVQKTAVLSIHSLIEDAFVNHAGTEAFDGTAYFIRFVNALQLNGQWVPSGSAKEKGLLPKAFYETLYCAFLTYKHGARRISSAHASAAEAFAAVKPLFAAAAIEPDAGVRAEAAMEIYNRIAVYTDCPVLNRAPALTGIGVKRPHVVRSLQLK